MTALAVAAIVALPGCGGINQADLTTGKRLFSEKCGGCHTLAEAGTKGNTGPDLDAAFRQSLADGLGRNTIRSVVMGQIRLPQGPKMPADLVTGKDAEAVADYVADVAGR